MFNDGNVTGISPEDLPKRTFGGETNANAYMLFYRKVSENTYEFKEEALPKLIKERIEEERKKIEEHLEHGGTQEELAIGSRHLTIKVYYKLEVKLLHILSSETFEQLQKVAFKEFEIQDTANCRLRGYVPHMDLLTDTYTGREQATLSLLKVQSYKNMAFEFKAPEQAWIEYDSSTLHLRYTVWHPELQSLENKDLGIRKLVVKKTMTFKELEEKIKECEKLEEGLALMKSHDNYGIEYISQLNKN